MSERIHERAAVLVDWSARIEAGDDMVVSVDGEAHGLAVAAADALGEYGANAVMMYTSEGVQRAYLRVHDDDFKPLEHELALYEAADSMLFLGGACNMAATADISAETQRIYGCVTSEVKEVRMDTDWVSTIHPTRTAVQQAGMSFEAHADFVYDTTPRSWSKFTERMANVEDVLDVGSEVRIVKVNTDLTMFIEGRTAVSSAASVTYDSHNLPSDEVFIVPVEDVVEGEAFFDVPMTLEGQRVENVHPTFEDGGVIDFSVGADEDTLAGTLDTGKGAHRLGELGVGINHGIDRFTGSVLFGEKMGDTVHFVVG